MNPALTRQLAKGRIRPILAKLFKIMLGKGRLSLVKWIDVYVKGCVHHLHFHNTTDKQTQIYKKNQFFRVFNPLLSGKGEGGCWTRWPIKVRQGARLLRVNDLNKFLFCQKYFQKYKVQKNYLSILEFGSIDLFSLWCKESQKVNSNVFPIACLAVVIVMFI